MTSGAIPYSQEIHGDLIDYLYECERGHADNLFHGPQHFFLIRDLNLMIPELTNLRVDNSPAPDISYFVNSDFLLESRGRGESNMSMVGAEKGIYDPNETLKDKLWSISPLDIYYTDIC